MTHFLYSCYHWMALSCICHLSQKKSFHTRLSRSKYIKAISSNKKIQKNWLRKNILFISTISFRWNLNNSFAIKTEYFNTSFIYKLETFVRFHIWLSYFYTIIEIALFFLASIQVFLFMFLPLFPIISIFLSYRTYLHLEFHIYIFFLSSTHLSLYLIFSYTFFIIY